MSAPAHAAAFYGSDPGAGSAALPYLHSGIADGAEVVVAVPAATEQMLRVALADGADDVTWHRGAGAGTPGGLSDDLRRLLLCKRGADAPVCLLSEFDDLGIEERFAAWLRFEALSNDVFALDGHRWLCLYDVRRHSDATLRRVRQVHPAVLGSTGEMTAAPEYLGPAAYLAAEPEGFDAVPAESVLDFRVAAADDLRELRATLRRWAAVAAVAQVDPLLVAVNEVVSNALEHAGPSPRVRTWVAGGLATVRVDSLGGGHVAEGAGYRPPDAPAGPGTGLWLARTLADDARVGPGRQGTAVQLGFMRKR